jgi:hypothetical protein
MRCALLGGLSEKIELAAILRAARHLEYPRLPANRRRKIDVAGLSYLPTHERRRHLDYEALLSPELRDKGSINFAFSNPKRHKAVAPHAIYSHWRNPGIGISYTTGATSPSICRTKTRTGSMKSWSRLWSPRPRVGLRNTKYFAAQLDKDYSGVDTSLRERPEKMFTVARLGIHGRAVKTLARSN